MPTLREILAEQRRQMDEEREWRTRNHVSLGQSFLDRLKFVPGGIQLSVPFFAQQDESDQADCFDS